MDEREHQFQTLCNRLYNFMKNLTKQVFKTVTLGHPVHKKLSKAKSRAAYESDQMANHRAEEETPSESVEQADNTCKSDPFVPLSSPSNGRKQDGEEQPEVQDNDAKIDEEKINSNDCRGEIPGEEAAVPSLEAKPPKKAVSINDRVEEIYTSNKKMRRKKSKENLTSFEQEEDEPKPLRSILKVGSFSGEQSNSFGSV